MEANQKKPEDVIEEGSDENTISCISLSQDQNLFRDDQSPSGSIALTPLVHKPIVPPIQSTQSRSKNTHSLPLP